MHINIFTRLTTRWRPAIGTWRQSSGIAIIFDRHSSSIPLESKIGQPGYRQKAWSVDELQMLQSGVDKGRSSNDIAESCVGLLPGRTFRAIEKRCQRLRGPRRSQSISEDHQQLLKLVQGGLTTADICAYFPHRRRRWIQENIVRFKMVAVRRDSPSRVLWTADEDEIISRGRALGKWPSQLAAELPGRAIASIDTRMTKLQQFGGQVRQPWKRWSAENDNVVMAMWKAGELHRTIASHLQRTVPSVEVRIHMLKKKEQEDKAIIKPSRSKTVAEGWKNGPRESAVLTDSDDINNTTN